MTGLGDSWRGRQQWKQQSSVRAKRALRETCTAYAGGIDPGEPFWQRKYYNFNLYSEKKVREKVEYMHLNPVRAGVVEQPVLLGPRKKGTDTSALRLCQSLCFARR